MKKFILMCIILFLTMTQLQAKSQSVPFNQSTQEERNQIAAKLIPIIMLILDDGRTQAIIKIKAYADDQTKPKPTVQDYINAGVTGVNAGNVEYINTIVASKSSSEVNTTTKIQALVDEINTSPNQWDSAKWDELKWQ